MASVAALVTLSSVTAAEARTRRAYDQESYEAGFAAGAAAARQSTPRAATRASSTAAATARAKAAAARAAARRPQADDDAYYGGYEAEDEDHDQHAYAPQARRYARGFGGYGDGNEQMMGQVIGAVAQQALGGGFGGGGFGGGGILGGLLGGGRGFGGF